MEDLLPALVPAAMRHARPSISQFPVGAVGLGSSGRIYVGVNLEFPGLPLNHSVHAEQFLLSNVAASGEAWIRCIAVSHMPCGHCRQFLQEVRDSSDIRIIVTSDGLQAMYRSLSVLLPRPFGPPDLLPKDVPLLLDQHNNEFGELVKALEDPVGECNGHADGEIEKKLKEAAEKAARGSHAPYSGSPAGFSVAASDGGVYGGSYSESAAFNPSISPIQAAIIAKTAAGFPATEIVAAALVEKENGNVSHEGTARVFLAAVAPHARLHVYRFK
ncbi:hypothetical protein LUZ60_000386 [Juncus effusus]|nr:hypothetical protein LUZ60_000386 [Juncus effusus]